MWRPPPLLLLLPLLFVILLLVTAIPSAAADGSSLFNFTLLHTNDIRGRVLPLNSWGQSCSMSEIAAANHTCIGGYPRRAGYINQVRAQRGDHVLLLDAGNIFFGSLFYAKFQGIAAADLINILQYDATNYGSGEFSGGVLNLKTYLDHLSTSISRVSSNIDVSAEPALAGKLVQWAVHNVSNRKVGVLGIAPRDLSIISSTGNNVKIDLTQTNTNHVNTALARLRLVHPDCNIIIVMSDDNFSTADIAKNVIGVTVIVEARDDDRRFNTSNPYPQVYSNTLGRPVLVVSTRRFGATIGHLNISVDTQGVVQAWAGDAVPLTADNAPRDPTVWTMVQNFATQLSEFTQEVVGSTPVLIYGQRGSESDLSGCRYSDCPAGRLVTRAMLHACSDCTIALVNAGGIRADIPAGNITRAHLLTTLPYQDSLSTLSLLGRDVISILQHGMTRGFGQFLQVGGMRVGWSGTSPATIIDAQVKVGGVFETLDVSKLYKVACGFFIRNGGDGYTWFKEQGHQFNDFLPLLDVVVSQYVASLNHVALDIPTKEQLQVCTTNIGELKIQENGVAQYDVDCHVAIASGKYSVLDRCSSDATLCASLVGKVLWGDFIPIASSVNCSSCTGLGTCSNQQCVCASAPYGTHAGLDMVRGDKCNVIRTEVIISGAWVDAVVVISFVTIALAFTSSAIYFYFRERPVIRRSAPFFSHIANGGIVVGASAVITSAWKPVSNTSCSLKIWMFSLSFAVIFGSMFVKQHRIFRLFKASTLLGQKRLSDGHMLRYLFIWVALLALIAALNQAGESSPSTRVSLFGTKETDEWSYHVSCNFRRNGGAFIFLFGAYALCLLVWGVYLSVRLRDIATRFNESTALAMIIYNATLSTTIVAGVLAFLGDSSPNASFVFLGLSANYIMLFSLGAVLVPKLQIIVYGEGRVHPLVPTHGDTARQSNHIAGIGLVDTLLGGGTCFPSSIKSGLHPMSPSLTEGNTTHLRNEALRAQRILSDPMSTTDMVKGQLRQLSIMCLAIGTPQNNNMSVLSVNRRGSLTPRGSIIGSEGRPSQSRPVHIISALPRSIAEQASRVATPRERSDTYSDSPSVSGRKN